jgi:hypothetical protein
MDVIADIFGSYIPLCGICGLTFFFFAIVVIVLISFIVALRTSAKAEKIAAEQEETLSKEEKVESKG